MGQAQQKMSFWQGFAKHVNVETTFTYNQLGQQFTPTLRRSGLLVQLNFNINGTIGVTTGTAPDGDTVTNFFPFIGLRSPQGLYLVTTSMRGLLDLNYRLYRATSPISDPSFQGPNVGATSTQNININFAMPLSLDPGINVETGILLRQLANNDFTLEMRGASSADLAGVGTAVFAAPNLVVTVEAVWSEIPNSAFVPPALNNYVRLRDQLLTQPLAAGANNDINYPVGPVILDILWRITENGAASSTNVQQIGLFAQTTNQIELRNADQIRLNNYQFYGKAFRNGVMLQQWVDDGAGVNESRMRDWINSAAAAQITLRVYTKAAFNTANSSAVATFRELMPLQQRNWITG